MANKNVNNKTFPLLNQIDQGTFSNDLDWNKNAFQTLLVNSFELYLSLKIPFRF